MNQKPISFMGIKTGGLFLFFMLLVFAGQAASPDSLRVRWIEGKKMVLHKVGPGETFSGLSRRYDIPVADIQAANPGVSSLKTGQIVNVPVKDTSSPSSRPVTHSPAEAPKQTPKETTVKPKAETPKQVQGNAGGGARTHTMQKGETLYRLSKMYGVTVDEIKAANGLTDNAVSIGQKLKIPAPTAPGPEKVPDMPVKEKNVETDVPAPSKFDGPAPRAAAEKTATAVVKEDPKPVPAKEDPKPVPMKEDPKPVPVKEDPKPVKEAAPDELPKVYSNPGTSRTSTIEKDPKTGLEVEKVVEVGVAAWMNEGELNQNKFYALHRTAPVGTIVKVTNRMNNNSVFVKVVGVLPETGDNNSFIIKITQAAAQRIGAIDQKFTAELSYGISK